MTFFGGVGGARGDDCCGGDASAAAAAASAAAAAAEAMSSASTRSGCKYLRRISETRANPSVDSSFTSLFTCGDGGDLERLAKGERERSRDSRRRRRGSTSSSSASSSSEQGLLLLLPMMLSMVNPELFALPLPPVMGDRRLTTGRLPAVAGAVGLGDRSPAPAGRNGGKRGESLVG